MVGLIPGFGLTTPFDPTTGNSFSNSAVDPLQGVQMALSDPTGAGANWFLTNVGAPPTAGNPAAAAAGGAPASSGMLGSLFQGVQAPEAPKPIFGSGAPAVNPAAADVNVNMPNSLSQVLKLLPGAQRAGLPTLGALIRGAI